MDLIESANEEHAIIGRSITVYTIDGRITTGVVRKADSKLLAIEHADGFFLINTSAIASMFIGKDGQMSVPKSTL
jgi:hypothetical protein